MKRLPAELSIMCLYNRGAWASHPQYIPEFVGICDSVAYSRCEQLKLDPSYVSRVANGKRNSETVTRALRAEMERLEKLKPR